MSDNRHRILSATLAAIMVLSMVAMATAPVVIASSGPSESVDTETPDPAVPTTDQSVEIDTAVEQAAEPTEVYIRFADPAIPDDLSDREAIASFLKDHTVDETSPTVDQLEGMGVDVINTYWITNAVRAEVDPTADHLDQITQLDGVEAISAVPEYELHGESDTAQTATAPDSDEGTWAWDQINVSGAWDQGVDGDDVNLAVLDTGVDIDHPDIDLYTEDEDDPTYPGGWAEIESDGSVVYTEPHDSQGHGTSVSGLAAGQQPDDDAPIDTYGVAPGVNLQHVKVFDGVFATDTLAGFEYAIDPDGSIQADITSKSFGAGPSVYDDTWIEPLQNARAMGIAPVTSSGNDGEGPGQVGSPANIYDSIGIGATGEDMDVVGFSSGWLEEKDNWNDPPEEWPEEWIEPSVVAPGEDVPTSSMGGGYEEASGTSFSAPAVAGIYALLMDYNEDAELDEYQEALEETAWKPDDWDEGDAGQQKGDADSRYGYGIAHAEDALEYLGPGLPEYDVGDVKESGEVTIHDLIYLEQYLAGMDPEPFNENLADINRDGNITTADSMLLEQYLMDMIEGGQVAVSNLTAPDEVEVGESIDIHADVDNVGDIGVLEALGFHLAEHADDLGTGEPLAFDAVDLAPEGANATGEVAFTVDTAGLPGGDYHHGVFSEDDNATDTITLLSPFFEVTDLDAPAEVDRGDNITVDAEITNVGNQNDTQDVTFQFAGEEIAVAEDISLTPNESQTVTFETVVDVEGGVYEHGVVTGNDTATANLTVNEWFFDVADVDGPETAEHGDEITVSANITNTGNATDEQTITYDLGGGEPGDVAIVTPEDTTRDHGDRFLAFFDQTLGDLDDDWSFAHVPPVDLLDEMDQYDTFLINRFGHADAGVPGDDLADDFLADLADDQAVVYLDSDTGATDETYGDGVERLVNVRDDPSSFDSTSNGEEDKAISILTDHDIFTDVGAPGESVPMFDDAAGSFGYNGWFNNYDGEVVADLDENDEPVIGIDEENNEILWASGAETFFTWEDDDGDVDPLIDRTDEGAQLLVNMVEYIQTGQVTGDISAPEDTLDETSTVVELDPGESTAVEFNYTVSADDGVGEFLHVVESDDDSDSAPITVTSPEQVDITDLDAPDEALQGEEITVETTVEHVGSEPTTQNVTFEFAGEVIDTEEVSLDPDEEATVTFTTEIPVDLEPGTYTHGVEVAFDEESATIDVLDADPPEFEVTDLDAPVQAGQGETISINATIENTGQLPDTQTVEYLFEIEDDGDDELENVDVAVVDSDLNTDAVRAELAERGLDEEAIEQHIGLLQANDLSGFIDSELDDDVFSVHNISSEDLMDETGHDVYVVSQFDGADVEDFMDETSDDTGFVHLDQWSSAQADGIESPHEQLDDPEVFETDLNFGADYFAVDILEDHPIFDGVGEQGEEVPLAMDPGDGAYFDEFSGETIGDFVWEGEEPLGGYVGVNDDTNQVLLSASARVSFVEHEEFTEEENIMLLNSIEYAAEQALLDGAGLASSPADASTELSLDGGETADVSFEYTIPSDQPPIAYEHGVFTEDDEQVDDLVVLERSADISVTGHFLEDDTVTAGENITTEAVVVNEGDAPGEDEIQLYFGEEIVASTTVDLEPGEVAIVELSAETTEDHTGDLIVSVNGQDPQLVTVEPGEESTGTIAGDIDVTDPDVSDEPVTVSVAELDATTTVQLDQDTVSYRIADVPTGSEYTIRATVPEHEPVLTEQVTVTEESEQTVDFRFDRLDPLVIMDSFPDNQPITI